MDNRPLMVVTGATNGLGRLAAINLASGGADLAVIARSTDKASRLRQEIEAAAPEAQVDFFFADMSRLSEVRRAGEEIDARYARIDVLANIAGVHAFSQRITAEGLSEMIAVNYLAPWVLTEALRPKLAASAPSRIVTVASDSARARPASFRPVGTTAGSRGGRRSEARCWHHRSASGRARGDVERLLLGERCQTP